jgi:hypothetical protein
LDSIPRLGKSKGAQDQAMVTGINLEILHIHGDIRWASSLSEDSGIIVIPLEEVKAH